MMRFFNKRTEDLEEFRDITDDVEESDFVPYACLYNDHTILTKNGELLQTIKILGVKSGVSGGHGEPADGLRTAIRNAVRQHIPSDAYALWFHTLRRQRNRDECVEFDSEFPTRLSDAWTEKYKLNRQYANEVYLTIVREGQDAFLRNMANIKKSFLPWRDLKWRNGYIDHIYGELDGVVSHIRRALEPYGVARLGVAEREGVYYSENVEFLEKIINLKERPMPVTDMDLSQYLTSGEITFGFNAMEVRVGDRRRFAAILTVKEYKEASLTVIDRFLQLPVEMIVTQCVDFINPNVALEKYKEQRKFIDISGDDDLALISELEDIFQSARNNPIDFGQQQLTVFVIADTVRELEDNIRITQAYLEKNGIVAIREDLHFEECYWAQLPGNFEFIARLTPTNTMHTAGFANLNNFPVGQPEGNRWGRFLMRFPTSNGVTYAFSFHVGQHGHTLIAGPKRAGKSVLAHLLLTHAMQFHPRLLYFDTYGMSGAFFEELGGRVFTCSSWSSNPKRPTIAINPFCLPPTPEHKTFIGQWLSALVRLKGMKPLPEHKGMISQAIEQTLSGPNENRHLTGFIEYLKMLHPSTATLFTGWLNDPHFMAIFGSGRDSLGESGEVICIQLRALIHDSHLMIPVISCLLVRAESLLDGKPSILMMEEAWRLLENTHIAYDIPGWLNRLTERNAIALYTIGHFFDCGDSAITGELARHAVTRIFLADNLPGNVYEDTLHLPKPEQRLLQTLDSDKHRFLLQQGEVTVLAEANLHGMPEVLKILTPESPKKESDAEAAAV